VSTGGGLRVGLPLNERWRVDLNYKFDNTERAGAGTCPVNVTACYFPDGTRTTSSTGYAVVYSSIDSYVDPHEGAYLRMAQDFAGLGGTAKYLRTVGDARYYRPLGTKTDIVGFVRASGGNITGVGQPVAIADNFFKGGETIRGFANLGYGPRDATSGLALGGRNFATATAEAQFPLPLVPADFGLKGAVFADAGVLYGVDIPASCATCTVVGADDKAIRTSVGGSILWASPFGLLRVDFARAMTKQSYDQTQFIRFGAGAQF
jgi:outer membrane protein insertion porin family